MNHTLTPTTDFGSCDRLFLSGVDDRGSVEVDPLKGSLFINSAVVRRTIPLTQSCISKDVQTSCYLLFVTRLC